MNGNRRLRAVNGLDLVYLRVARSYSAAVRGKLHSALHRALAEQPMSATMRIVVENAPGRSDTIDVPLERAIDETLAGIEGLKQTGRNIEIGPTGEALIRDTGIEAHRIAALVEGGMSIDDVLHDYPNLSAEKVETAIAYARAHPKQGRPYPARTVKSVFRRGTGLMREVLSEEECAPDDEARKG